MSGPLLRRGPLILTLILDGFLRRIDRLKIQGIIGTTPMNGNKFP